MGVGCSSEDPRGEAVGLGSSSAERLRPSLPDEAVQETCQLSPSLRLLAVEFLGSETGMDEGVFSGAAGLEDIGPEMVSTCWVVENCLDFCPKIGLTDEGRKEDLVALFHSIEESRVQPDFDWGGNSANILFPKEIGN